MPRLRVFEVPPASGTLRQLVNVNNIISVVVLAAAPGPFVVALNSNATNQQFIVGNFATEEEADAEAEVWRARIDDAP